MAFAVVFFSCQNKIMFNYASEKTAKKAQTTKQNKERSSEKNHLETIVIHAHI